MGQGPCSTASEATSARLASRLPLRCPDSTWAASSDGRWRWAVDADAWNPPGGSTSAQFGFLLGLLPDGDERTGVVRFPASADAKRCLLGRLLAHRACACALGHDNFEGFQIGRTHGQKPFLRCPLPPGLPNFNFNVSHDGRWVVLASDPLRLVGADVSAPQRARGDAEDERWRDDLATMLSDKEKSYIEMKDTALDRYSIFQRIWSAKESVAKAVGQGLDYGLERIEVTLDGTEPQSQWSLTDWLGPSDASEEASVSEVDAKPKRLEMHWASVDIDMWPRPDWDLQQQALSDNHWCTVALGPIEEAVDQIGEFRSTLRLPAVDEAARNLLAETAPEERNPRFQVLPIPALVPRAFVDAYAAMLNVQNGQLF
mmetsp:Transcript_122319/g.237929  ORF Transcript_122319/g.237929 Transcript_122319/m.237929 type:complete len:372 (+) Transcript_122319:122-1237(+)